MQTVTIWQRRGQVAAARVALCVLTLTCLALALAARPAAAQIDLEGNWAPNLDQDYHSRLDGPPAVDYLGIPLNAQARAAALSYSADTITEPARQCVTWQAHYLLLGTNPIHIWADINRITGQVSAWNISGWGDYTTMKIWMGGQKPPKALALRNPSGFSTGHWEGDTLVSTTTEMNDGYLTRNGVPSSDRETFTVWISRYGNLLNITGFIQDPVYLTQPYALSRNYTLETAAVGSGLLAQTPCMQVDEVPAMSHGLVPNFLPGKNPALMQLTREYHIPLDAVLGGAQTMYPQFRDKIRAAYNPPAKCTVNCCGWGDFRKERNPLLACKEQGP